MASSSAEYDAFLTHDWGNDELGRSNHARVAEVNRLLKAAGFVTWFDEDRMQGDIVSQMANGIDSSAAERRQLSLRCRAAHQASRARRQASLVAAGDAARARGGRRRGGPRRRPVFAAPGRDATGVFVAMAYV